MTDHATAVKAAQHTTRELGRLFDTALGSVENPRGAVMAAYRVARAAMETALDRGHVGDVADVMNELRKSVEATARVQLSVAVDLGAEQAVRELAAREIRAEAIPPDPVDALNAWLGIVDTQTASILGLFGFGGDVDPALILGDETRLGLLAPGPALKEGARWMTLAAMMGWSRTMEASARRRKIEFNKQAVAAIDERTTECCLRVHGQVVAMKAKFHLTGTPRFADDMDWSPFHFF